MGDGVVWSQISVGVAAILGLIYVARTLRGVVRESLQSTANLQSETLTFLGNHMSKNTKALTDVGNVLSSMSERVDRLHDDNIDMTGLLRTNNDLVLRDTLSTTQITTKTAADIVQANKDTAQMNAEKLTQVQATALLAIEREDERKRIALLEAADKLAAELVEADKSKTRKVEEQNQKT